jgi:hypothetical protein
MAWSAEKVARLRKMANEGLTAKIIAERMGVCPETVRDNARKCNIIWSSEQLREKPTRKRHVPTLAELQA